MHKFYTGANTTLVGVLQH